MKSFFKKHWFAAWALLSFGLALVIIVGVFWIYDSYQTEAAMQPYQPGVTFSTPYAKELGVDPHETFLALLDDLKIRKFRLMSYWDRTEPQPGKYTFEDLDFQMDNAARAGAKVSLAVGLRQPRWPECHQPAWVDTLSKTEQRQRLEAFMAVVVKRYRSHPALESYQLENEALNTAFGTCKDFDRARLVSEFKLIKSLDPNHPIIVSVSNEYGIPLGQPKGDIVGFSIYRRVYDAKITKRYVTYPFPAWYFGLKAAFIDKVLGQPVMIHELQTEPWGPKPTVQMSIEEQSLSMDATRVLNTVKYIQSSGIRQYYLWGGEWWYWRKVKFNDSSLWDAAKTIYVQQD